MSSWIERGAGGYPVKCPYCEGMRYVILRIPDMTSKVGFRQTAKMCDHREPPAIRDGKGAAASDVTQDTATLSME